MAQKIASPLQVRVLRRMSHTLDEGVHITIPEMADIAPVESGKREWARDPLRALEKNGFVERTPVIVGHKTATWRITLAGVEALMASI